MWIVRDVALDVVKVTKDLVAVDSVSRNSNLPVAAVLEPILRAAGFTVERIAYTDADGVEKVNLVGVKGNGTDGLGFFSHVDTVPGAEWDRDPWSPVVENERLIGLGSCDMKGPLAATVVAAAQVDASRLKRPILIAATADEEIGYGGAKEVLARSEALQAAGLRHGVVAEPTSLTPVYAHKGGAMVYVTAHGVAAHTSLDRGVSANFLIAPFLVEMAEMAARLKDDPSYHRAEFNPPTLGFNMTIDDFGCKSNVTAPKSRASVGFRPMPNDRSADVLAEVQERAKRYGFEVTTSNNPPFAGSPDAPIVQAVVRATGNTATTAPYGTEAVIFQEICDLVVLGPGDIGQAHTNGEWIAVSQLHDAVDVYTRLIDDLCC